MYLILKRELGYVVKKVVSVEIKDRLFWIYLRENLLCLEKI